MKGWGYPSPWPPFGQGCLGRGDVAENQLGQLIRLAIPPDLRDMYPHWLTLVPGSSGNSWLIIRWSAQLAAIRSDLEHIVHGWVNRSAVLRMLAPKGLYHLLLGCSVGWATML